jgi:hypothetical protein
MEIITSQLKKIKLMLGIIAIDIKFPICEVAGTNRSVNTTIADTVIPSK